MNIGETEMTVEVLSIENGEARLGVGDLAFWMAEGDTIQLTTVIQINGTEARDGVGGASREAGAES